MTGKGKAVLIVGVVFLVFGIFGYALSAHNVGQYESTWGEMYRGLDESGSAQQQYAALKIIQIVSILLIVAGIIMILAEGIIYIKEPAGMQMFTSMKASHGVPALRYCQKCGTELVPGHRFCSGCGVTI